MLPPPTCPNTRAMDALEDSVWSATQTAHEPKGRGICLAVGDECRRHARCATCPWSNKQSVCRASLVCQFWSRLASGRHANLRHFALSSTLHPSSVDVLQYRPWIVWLLYGLCAHRLRSVVPCIAALDLASRLIVVARWSAITYQRKRWRSSVVRLLPEQSEL